MSNFLDYENYIQKIPMKRLKEMQQNSMTTVSMQIAIKQELKRRKHENGK